MLHDGTFLPNICNDMGVIDGMKASTYNSIC